METFSTFYALTSRWLLELKFTLILRPFNSYSFIFRIALSAACGSSNSTKANPRGLPVSTSDTRRTLITLPISENAWCNCSSVVLKARLPTKMSCFCCCCGGGCAVRRKNIQTLIDKRRHRYKQSPQCFTYQRPLAVPFQPQAVLERSTSC